MKIHEVAARDGLQNEKTIFSTDQKMRLLELLAQTKPDSLEVTSFVRADRVPQFADAVELCHRLKSAEWREGIPLVGLVMNMRGFLFNCAYQALKRSRIRWIFFFHALYSWEIICRIKTR